MKQNIITFGSHKRYAVELRNILDQSGALN